MIAFLLCVVASLAASTPECEDVNRNCGSVPYSKCTHPDWTGYMRKYCARTCSFCDGGEGPSPDPECVDINTNCIEFDLTKCSREGSWADYMKKYCKRTCKYC